VSAADRQREALRRVADHDAELAARLVLMTLPAAAATIPTSIAYELDVDGVGAYRVSVADGRARVDPADGQPIDFSLSTDARSLVDLALGDRGPMSLALRRRLRIGGSRRKALALRRMSSDQPEAADIVRAGGSLDPDLLYRSLPYLIEPEWTRGHRFTVGYEISGDPEADPSDQGGGRWWAEVRDGEPVRVTTEEPEHVDATARISYDAYQRIATGELTPSQAMQDRLTDIDGLIYPVTLLGRWIERSQGRDDAEMEREAGQRAVQEARDGGGFAASGGRPETGALLGYRQLYALWERQNWRASEIDFSADREHWLATPAEAQENTIWSLGSFYVAEERVTADLAPFLTAAPSGEVELFLSTQLVDEARHVAFFDRFGAEVMAFSADDLRGRMREVERRLQQPWHDVFDGGLRDVSNRIKARPDDLDLFVEGIATYHIVLEGFLAVTGQAMIRQYMLDHGLYPGFCEGFGLVERDEHRHIAFGVRFLKDAIEQDPRHARTVERVVLDLAPRSAHVFVPPYVEDPREFVSYGYHSSEVYGYAYHALKRRMGVLGLDIPPPEELMPGPIAGGVAQAPAPV
jgi:ribonucleoside-diphosphate reductase beta chain